MCCATTGDSEEYYTTRKTMIAKTFINHFYCGADKVYYKTTAGVSMWVNYPDESGLVQWLRDILCIIIEHVVIVKNIEAIHKNKEYYETRQLKLLAGVNSTPQQLVNVSNPDDGEEIAVKRKEKQRVIIAPPSLKRLPPAAEERRTPPVTLTAAQASALKAHGAKNGPGKAVTFAGVRKATAEKCPKVALKDIHPPLQNSKKRSENEAESSSSGSEDSGGGEGSEDEEEGTEVDEEWANEGGYVALWMIVLWCCKCCCVVWMDDCWEAECQQAVVKTAATKMSKLRLKLKCNVIEKAVM